MWTEEMKNKFFVFDDYFTEDNSRNVLCQWTIRNRNNTDVRDTILECSNNHPITVQDVVVALDRMNNKNCWSKIKLEEALGVIILFKSVCKDEVRGIGNFMNYIMDKIESFDDIEYLESSASGHYYLSRLELLQSDLKKSNSLVKEIIEKYKIKPFENPTLLQKYDSLIEKLEDTRVFSIGQDEDDKDYYIYERCDEYFSHQLTSELAQELSNLFGEIAVELKENKL